MAMGGGGGSGGGRGRRRARKRPLSEINVTPLVDVMLVLLIIFMVTAPMLTPGNIDVPSAGQASKPSAKNVAHILMKADGSIQLQTPNNQQTLSLAELGQVAASWQQGLTEDSAVVIHAEKGMIYENVIEAMDALHQAGVKRVALGVKSSAK